MLSGVNVKPKPTQPSALTLTSKYNFSRTVLYTHDTLKFPLFNDKLVCLNPSILSQKQATNTASSARLYDIATKKSPIQSKEPRAVRYLNRRRRLIHLIQVVRILSNCLS